MSNIFKGVIRQGDVLLLPMKNSNIKNIKGKSLSHLTLAHGEVTGHSHRISTGKAELYEKNGVLYLRVLSQEVTLKHEEHDNLKIPRGDWMVRIQREYQPVKNNIKPSPKVNFYHEKEVQNPPLNNNNKVDKVNKIKSDLVRNKDTVIQSTKDTIIQSITESSTVKEKNNNLWEDEEMHQLASQINTKYWNKKVNNAEKRKEYLDKIQAKSKQKENENESQKDDKNKKPVRKKIKYNDTYEYDWQKPKFHTFVARPTTPPSKSSHPLTLPSLPNLPSLPSLPSLPKIELFKSSKVENTPQPKARARRRRLRQNQFNEQQNWRDVVD